MREFAQALREPAFSGHADPTIAATRAPSAATTTRSTGPSAPSITMQPIPPPPPPPMPPPQVPSAYRTSSVPVYPAPMPHVAPTPPGYVLVPQSTLASLQPLPSAFGQGCLWGLLQGIVAATMLLILKKDFYFYLATTMGLLFYLLAGFLTTRKGGSFSRGAWAGLWAGITSTFVFWIVLAIGLIVLVSQRIQADTQIARQQGSYLGPNEYGYAFRAVAPIILTHPATRSLSSTSVGFLLAGLVLAILFGLFGGILGRLEHQDAIKNRSNN